MHTLDTTETGHILKKGRSELKLKKKDYRFEKADNIPYEISLRLLLQAAVSVPVYKIISVILRKIRYETDFCFKKNEMKVQYLH